jgi:hypothetical protein
VELVRPIPVRLYDGMKPNVAAPPKYSRVGSRVVWDKMLNVRSQAKPVAYLYLDASGIEGLYAQTVDRLEVEHSTTVEKARSGPGLR